MTTRQWKCRLSVRMLATEYRSVYDAHRHGLRRGGGSDGRH
jgi:hypothetical protein